ncbi:MAG TPA: hypothetical protein VGH72_33875 [Pseudonocardia sp.]|jgi:ribosomal protein S27E
MSEAEATSVNVYTTNLVHAGVPGDPMHRGSTEKTLCRPTGHNARTGTFSNRGVVYYATKRPVTCKACLKRLAA